MKLQSILAWSGLWSLATAADAADWRSRSIYQVMTDRYATHCSQTLLQRITYHVAGLHEQTAVRLLRAMHYLASIAVVLGRVLSTNLTTSRTWVLPQ